jgi:uncharacterized protein (DUF1330 family)
VKLTAAGAPRDLRIDRETYQSKEFGQSMSAYLVIEATVRDREALDRYASQSIPSLAQFGGEVIAFEPWQMLFGEPAYDNGMIVRFPDKAAALAWYNSPVYQALLTIREAALDCRFRLVG